MTSGIHISTNKTTFGENEELVIHIWFERDLSALTTFIQITSPSGKIIDSTPLKAKKDITETFAFTCGQTLQENGKYTIAVSYPGGRLEKIFEYYNSRNEFNPSNYV